MSTAYGTLLAHASPKMVDLATLLPVVKNRPFCSSDSEPLISSIAMPYFIRHHKIGKPPDSKYGCRKKMLPGDNLRVMSSIVANQRKSRYLATKQK